MDQEKKLVDELMKLAETIKEDSKISMFVVLGVDNGEKMGCHTMMVGDENHIAMCINNVIKKHPSLLQRMTLMQLETMLDKMAEPKDIKDVANEMPC